MADSSLFDPLRLSAETLIQLDNRTFHFAIQPVHYVVRMAHLLSASAFFGGIVLFDLRLIGVRSAAKLQAFADDILPWLYVVFAVAIATGVVLFLYDPVKMGSRAYFMPKVLLLLFGLANAAAYHRFGYNAALNADGSTLTSAKLAGLLSIGFWTAVMAFSSLNVEGVPKLLLNADNAVFTQDRSRVDGLAGRLNAQR